VEYGSGQDPLLLAGVLRCTICGRAAFPVDATWVDELVLLADYGRPCPHTRGGLVLVDLRGLDVGQQFVRLMSAAELARYVPGRRCLGRNRFGKPCRAYAGAGSDYCDHHGAQTARGRER
jgi:hypothetical protein